MRDVDRTESPPGARVGSSPLALLVTGDAPRSNRARSHLQDAMRDTGLPHTIVHEIDVLRDPLVAIRFRVFATPALVAVRDDRAAAVLYGDLSDPEAVRRFLLDVVRARVGGEDGEPDAGESDAGEPDAGERGAAELDGGEHGGRTPQRSGGRSRCTGG